MPPRLLVSALAFAVALTAASADARSVVPTYRVPTTLELAGRADTIVLGTVESQEGEEGDSWERAVVVRPTLLLKGAALPVEVRLHGVLADPARLRAERDAGRERRPIVAAAGGAEAGASIPVWLKGKGPDPHGSGPRKGRAWARKVQGRGSHIARHCLSGEAIRTWSWAISSERAKVAEDVQGSGLRQIGQEVEQGYRSKERFTVSPSDGFFRCVSPIAYSRRPIRPY